LWRKLREIGIIGRIGKFRGRGGMWRRGRLMNEGKK